MTGNVSDLIAEARAWAKTNYSNTIGGVFTRLADALEQMQKHYDEMLAIARADGAFHETVTDEYQAKIAALEQSQPGEVATVEQQWRLHYPSTGQHSESWSMTVEDRETLARLFPTADRSRATVEFRTVTSTEWTPATPTPPTVTPNREALSDE